MKVESGSGTYGGGTSLATLLLVAFIILKLCHVIAWSWVWVLSPLWISAGIAILIIAAILLVALIATMRD